MWDADDSPGDPYSQIREELTMKKPAIKEQADKVIARYGKTLGASKGSKPTPKVSVRVRPRVNKDGVHGLRAKVTKKF